MNSSFDEEQKQLLTEVANIRDHKLRPKRTGADVCSVVQKYIQLHPPANYRVSAQNSYVGNISTEFDLLVVKAGVDPKGAAYEPNDVRVVLEIKTAGIRKKEEDYPKEIKKIRDKFDSVRQINSKVWGVLLLCSGTITTAKQGSIDYEKMRKNGLEPYGYNVYTLRDARKKEPELGKWQEFIETLLSKLD